MCNSCKNLYYLTPDNANFCPHCGKDQLDELEGRFILRCKTCGLTQNKRAFTKLHGDQALRCQSSVCNGPIKTITIRRRKKASHKQIVKKKAPRVPNRRKLQPKLDRDMIRSQKLTPISDPTAQPADVLSNAESSPVAVPPTPQRRSLDNSNTDMVEPAKREISISQPEDVEEDVPVEKDHASLRPGDYIQMDKVYYKIVEKLGTGGMGAVWKAESHENGDVVAIKEFYYTRYHDPETGKNHCERYWKRESDISKIQTESLEPSMDFLGSAKIDRFKVPEYYIFLDYVEGKDLDKWYTERYKEMSDLTIKELRMIVRDILQPIARHMYYVHQKGIIHRDLTVQNVIIQESEEGRIKPIVIDWGVAKKRPKEALYNPRKPYYVSSTPEATGIRNRGTPPEVMAGFQPIAVTDVYMLGHIMFYLFSGGNYAGTAATHEDFVLHPADYNPDLPPDFNKIVEYMTQYEPADRMRDMIKVHEALQWLYETTAHLENPEIERSKYYLHCDWNDAYIEIPEGEILKLGRDEIISKGTNNDMDGHLHRAFVPAEEGKYQLALFIEDDYLYVRDLHSKKGTFISKLTSTNQQVYDNIPIKGLDNVVVLLSEANLGVTKIEVEYIAPDGKTYRIPFKILDHGPENNQ